jgi:hypothetical protein
MLSPAMYRLMMRAACGGGILDPRFLADFGGQALPALSLLEKYFR